MMVFNMSARMWQRMVKSSRRGTSQLPGIRDANALRWRWYSVTVIKDLKVKGSSLVVKVGTKVKNIRLVDGDHDIDCKVDGIGPMKLKSEFVKSIVLKGSGSKV